MSRCALPPPPRVELLAPAGTPAKLRCAFHFGADAVYLGLRAFSLRAQAGNFGWDELEWALGYAEERGRRVYVALNLQPFDSDAAGIEAALRRLAELRPHGLIVADPGVLSAARRLAPGLPLHLSTQASVTNAAAARFWFEQGLQRIILARELSLAQLATLAQGAPGELEVFVHGAVCVAYSGRCLLSLYGAGERHDPRRGSCAQGCRWRYREIEDLQRPGERQWVEQDERGSYFFDAKDLCALPLLPELLATGVCSLKIEGRSRSIYYLGLTVDVYRQALDHWLAGDLAGFAARKETWLRELARGSRREFSTHFLGGEQDLASTYSSRGAQRGGASEALGQVLERVPGGLKVRLSNPLGAGEAVELRDRGGLCEACCATPLLDPEGTPLERAREGQEVLLLGDFGAGPGALLRRA